MLADRENFKNLRAQLRRDQFAQAALAGLLAVEDPARTLAPEAFIDRTSRMAVALADRLIAELDASLPKSKMAPGFTHPADGAGGPGRVVRS